MSAVHTAHSPFQNDGEGRATDQPDIFQNSRETILEMTTQSKFAFKHCTQ